MPDRRLPCRQEGLHTPPRRGPRRRVAPSRLRPQFVRDPNAPQRSIHIRTEFRCSGIAGQVSPHCASDCVFLDCHALFDKPEGLLAIGGLFPIILYLTQDTATISRVIAYHDVLCRCVTTVFFLRHDYVLPSSLRVKNVVVVLHPCLMYCKVSKMIHLLEQLIRSTYPR